MFLRNGAMLGVDLGTTGARAMELSWRDGRPTVERWSAADFPAEVSDWRNVSPQEIGELVRQLTVRRGMRARWAAHSVSGENVAPQYFNFPQLMPEDVAEAVRIEVETAVPFRVEDALISFVLFPEQRTQQGKARTHGLAIAADGTFVESRLNAIRAADLEPFCVETDATACANAFLATRPLPEDGTTAIINIGHRFSNLALLAGPGTLLVRDIPWAGSHITQGIAAAISVPPAEAESLKRKHWEEGPEAAGSLDSKIGEVLYTAGRELVSRIRDTVEFWVSERLVPGLGRIFLTGGGSQVHGLPELLAEAFSVPVERWSPLAENALANGAEIRPWRYRMSVAFGLALRRFDRAKA